LLPPSLLDATLVEAPRIGGFGGHIIYGKRKRIRDDDSREQARKKIHVELRGPTPVPTPPLKPAPEIKPPAYDLTVPVDFDSEDALPAEFSPIELDMILDTLEALEALEAIQALEDKEKANE
jgi:hypothetical protein